MAGKITRFGVSWPSEIFEAVSHLCSQNNEDRSGYLRRLAIFDLQRLGIVNDDQNSEKNVIAETLATVEAAGPEKVLAALKHLRETKAKERALLHAG